MNSAQGTWALGNPLGNNGITFAIVTLLQSIWLFNTLLFLGPSMTTMMTFQQFESRVLVGYNEVSKAYRVYIPGSRKVILSWDVRFDEGRALRRSHEKETTTVEDREREAPKAE